MANLFFFLLWRGIKDLSPRLEGKFQEGRTSHTSLLCPQSWECCLTPNWCPWTAHRNTRMYQPHSSTGADPNLIRHLSFEFITFVENLWNWLPSINDSRMYNQMSFMTSTDKRKWILSPVYHDSHMHLLNLEKTLSLRPSKCGNGLWNLHMDVRIFLKLYITTKCLNLCFV